MSDELIDAIMPAKWYDALPREQYSSFEYIHTKQDWFSVYKLPNNIYAIYEPKHFQEVISFLVLGNTHALLIDTGMGIGDISSVVNTLTSLPITVVNTHCHFDHIGGNNCFDKVHIFDNDLAILRMQNGMSQESLSENMVEGANAEPYPDGFDPKTYSIKPCDFELIKEGHLFDLGGRFLEVIHTPGHSPDSIMLVDRQNKLLFTGDTFYPATLYAHTPDGITSDINVYLNTMSKLALEFSDYTLICSHNEPIRDGSFLSKVSEAFEAINEKSINYLTDAFGIKKYCFDGFCIVTH